MKREMSISVLLFVVLAFSWGAQPVAALSCTPAQNPAQELAASDVVFQGTVIEVKADGRGVFEVEQIWKGVDSPTIELYDDGWGPYQEQVSYLVFGSERDGQLAKNLCGWTGVWDSDREAMMAEAGGEPLRVLKDADGNRIVPSGAGSALSSWRAALWVGGLLLLPASWFIIKGGRRWRR